MKKHSRILKLIGLIFLLSACIHDEPRTENHISTVESWRCGISESQITELDLVGVWVTSYRSESRFDTLILSDNGTYKQIYINNETGYKYESETNNWWIEVRADGGAYLHLKGMLYCGGAAGTCLSPNDSGEFYDYCGDAWFDMKEEFILSLVRDTDVPEGIRLRHMKPIGYETYFVNYTLSSD
jgi:hypothetical protein